MTNTYFDLIDQTFYFPQDGFDLEDGYLQFRGVPLKYLIDKYGTPFKFTYLPNIGVQIKRAKNLFTRAIKSLGYGGKYYYCYCTKSAHFKHILDEVLEHGVHLETSSAFDIDLVRKLYEANKIDKQTILINNGFKPRSYVQKIVGLIEDGFENVIPVLDNKSELDFYKEHLKNGCNLGIRVATDEEPNFEFYTSRLGIRNKDVIPFFEEQLLGDEHFKVKMLHFFVDTGIRDTLYYWGELKKAIDLYCSLRKVCDDLTAINIGGGLPIRNSLGFEFDYKYMIRQIVEQIQTTCEEAGVPEPDIYTEFGSYTVGESGATIFSVLDQKQQNDNELWYMIDNSLMTTLPDSWGISQRFILLPINKWKSPYTRVNIGGLSCDNSDYYNSEVHLNQVYLPQISEGDSEPLYLGFFHTGAYQDAISGHGGIKHCLIPSPKHILVDRNQQGNLVDSVIFEEQKPNQMLQLLGY
ncbi:MAG: arginine decarboxylase [Bacteroidota bacterium]